MLDKILRNIKKLIPKSVFDFFAPMYHAMLAYAGAIAYGFPSRSMKIIGVTGTKGKSTTVYLVSKIFEEAGEPVAAVGSLGFKIKDKEWPNNLKMTMPGRFKLQKFLKQAKNAGVKYAALEVTSEGIKQKRHLGINFDCAVLTGIHREHIESHGTFEKYVEAKKKLFYKTKNIHILNADDKLAGEFRKIKSLKKFYYTLADWEKQSIETKLAGDFNKYNILAAMSVAQAYGIDKNVFRKAIEKVDSVPGRMEYVYAGQPFKIVIDYAHTPDSLRQVYETLRGQLEEGGNLICVLGAAGGGRDKWKRPEFGRIAVKYCDEIILTNEDSYDEIPEKIIEDIFSGISSGLKFKSPKSPVGLGPLLGLKIHKILDRQGAIKEAVTRAYRNDIVVVTGKGSENSIAGAGGKKVPWSERDAVIRALGER